MGTPTTRPLKAAIFDPYLNSLGGGERYCLTVAEILLELGWQVDLLWSGDPRLIAQAQEAFSLDLSRLQVNPSPIFGRPQDFSPIANATDLQISPKIFAKPQNLWQRFHYLRRYDLLFYLSDGSLPFLFAQKNLLHLQVPLPNQPTLWQKTLNRVKLIFINQIIYNSRFTLNHTPYLPQSKALILYPPVDVAKFAPAKKQNLILSVGRFDDILNIKRQDILIEAFKQLHSQNWRLVLAGNSLQKPELNHYLTTLKNQARGYPIEFLVGPKFDDLQKLYSQAKIYWHAAGYQIDENLHPQLTEHFGISVVEAMASAAVPLVTARGGLPEIVQDGVSGYLWDNLSTLVSQTQKLLDSPSLVTKISQESVKTAQNFSKDHFKNSFLRSLSL